MAFNAAAWIPIEIDGPAVEKWYQDSAVERVAKGHNMKNNQKDVPVQGTFTVGGKRKNEAYVSGSTSATTVSLVSRVLGGTDEVANEDLEDGYKVIQMRANAGGGDLAMYLDNACLGVTAAEDFANNINKPFNSVYQAVKAANPTNVIATGGALVYADLTNAFAKASLSKFFTMSDAVVLADDSLMWHIQGLVDSDNRPLLTLNTGADGRPGGFLFGVPVVWTKGARTSALATSDPEGNSLLIVTTKSNLLRGDGRLDGSTTSLPGFKTLAGTSDENFENEVTKVKVSVRRGFKLATPAAAAIVEITA